MRKAIDEAYPTALEVEDETEGMYEFWSAVAATASSSMRIRLHEIGGDVDEVIQQVDRFLLTNPQ